MGRPRKARQPAPPHVPDESTKHYVEAHERDAVYGLDQASDQSDDQNSEALPLTKNAHKKLRGEDFVGTIDMDADHVFELDVPTDSDVSDADRDFLASDDERTSGWGSRRNDFYNADDTFADDEAAKIEEQEAVLLRKQRLQKLNEEDFLDDFFMKLVKRSGSGGTTIRSNAPAPSLTDLEVIEQRPRDDMGTEEMMEFLATTSPDLLEFILEYTQQVEDLKDVLFPMFALAHQLEPADSPVYKYLATKYYTVLGLLLNITFYLSLYAKGVPRREIRRHPVVGVLVQLKKQLDAIQKIETEQPWLVERLEPLISATEDMDELNMNVNQYIEHVNKELRREMEGSESGTDSGSEYGSAGSNLSLDGGDDNEESVSESQKPARIPGHLVAPSNKRRRPTSSTPPVQNSEIDADLAALPLKKRKMLAAKMAEINKATAENEYSALVQATKTSKSNPAPVPNHAINEDFDEFNSDHAHHLRTEKKPLKKIVQTVRSGSKSKPAISADADVGKMPKKSQELNIHLSKDAINSAERDADLFSDEDINESGRAHEPNINAVGINMNKVDPSRPISSLIEARAQKNARKIAKQLKKVSAQSGLSVAEYTAQYPDAVKAMGDDDDMNDMSSTASNHIQRKASYSILKNRGLTPKRKKEDRNPRVKHRRKFETKMKKLKTVKRMVTDLRAGYQGELTGIKTHLTRQVNLT